ncbi:hypothetical protein Tco_1251736 [Tanacetum coccineum]
MDIVARINDPQCELLLLRACAGIFKLYFAMRTCSPWVFEMAQRSFDVAFHSALERIITASGSSFGDWLWRLTTLLFAFGGLSVYSLGDVLNYTFLASRLQSSNLQTKLLRHSSIVAFGSTFDDALCVFNTKMETDILSNLSVPLFSISKPCSACSRVFAGGIYGDHVVSCARIIGIKHRHKVVRDTLVDICFRSGISADKEVDIGLGGGRDKPLCPAYKLLYSWDKWVDVCVDLTGSSLLMQTRMVDFMVGRAVTDAAHRKPVKYETKCLDIGYGFLSFSFSSLWIIEGCDGYTEADPEVLLYDYSIWVSPLFFSSFGKLEDDAIILLKRIRKFSMVQDIGARVVVHIFNRISFAIAKGVMA